MARTSLAAAKAELFAFVGTADNTSPISGVAGAYDHERAWGNMANPVAITVSTEGYDPDFWTFAVRIYSDARSDARKAASVLDTLMPLVEDVIDGHWGAVVWNVTFRPELKALVAEWIVQAGRED